MRAWGGTPAAAADLRSRIAVLLFERQTRAIVELNTNLMYIVGVLTVQLLTPNQFPRGVRNGDLRQNIDLLRLGEFVTGNRAIRCIPTSLVLGNLGTIVPYAANRALGEISSRAHTDVVEPFRRLVANRAVMVPDRSADVLLGHGLFPWIPFQGKRRSAPLLWGPGYMHDDFFEVPRTSLERSATDARLKSSARRVGGVFLTTNEAVDRWHRNIGVPSREYLFTLPIFMVRCPRSRELRAVSKPNGGPLEVLFVGRQARRKNLPALISALDALHASRSVHLTVVSDFLDGPVDVNRSYITYLSDVTDAVLVDLMRRAHVFAMVSRRESFGLVYVEALANGCAILAPKRTAQIDMLGDCAAYADPFNVEDIRRALDDLLASAEWERKGEHAMRRYAQRYAPDVVANAFFDALTRVASNRAQG